MLYTTGFHKTALIYMFSFLLMLIIGVVEIYAQLQENEVDFDYLDVVVLKEEDTLWKLATKHYGDPLLWSFIAEMNKLKDFKSIPVGTRIYIPVKEAKRAGEKVKKAAEEKDKTTLEFSEKLRKLQTELTRVGAERDTYEGDNKRLTKVLRDRDATIRELQLKVGVIDKLSTEIADLQAELLSASKQRETLKADKEQIAASLSTVAQDLQLEKEAARELSAKVLELQKELLHIKEKYRASEIEKAQSTDTAIIHVPGDYPMIQEGMDAAMPGDTVLVASGIYTGYGNRDLDFRGKAITVTSEEGAEATVIDCEGIGRGFYFHSDETPRSIVSGFTVRNGAPGHAYRGAICCVNSSSPTIENNIITDNQGGGIYCNRGSSPIIQNNIINSNSADSGGGILCANSSDPTIHNNNIYDNSATEDGGGISSRLSSPSLVNNVITGNSAGYGGGVFCRDTPAMEIINTTISGNSATEAGGGIYYMDSCFSTILNTVIWANTPDGISTSPSSWIDVTYSDIQELWPGKGNISVDPLFTDGYHLGIDSPCIGGAMMTADVPDKDIAGNPRPNPPNSRPDMGAYEEPSVEADEVSTLPSLYLGGPLIRDPSAAALSQLNMWPNAPVTDSPLSVHMRSPGKAFALSAVVPGAGQFYSGSNRWIVFTLAELSFLLSHILIRGEAEELEDDYLGFSEAHIAFADDSTVRSTENWTLRDYQQATEVDSWHHIYTGPEGMPPERLGKFYWDDLPEDKIERTDTESGPQYPPYTTKMVSQSRAEAFEKQRSSNDRSRQAKIFLGLVVINHIVSAIDGRIAAKTYNNETSGARAALSLSFHPTIVPSGHLAAYLALHRRF